MKALSLHEPWASAVGLELKKFETRGKRTLYRGELAIHAALRWTRDLLYGCVPITPEWVEANVSDDEFELGNYAAGRFAWLLRNLRLLETPLPLQGRQWLWQLDPGQTAEVLARIRTAA